MKTVYIIKGEVTDPDVQPGSKLGDVEWQFSDGPAGNRSGSDDYIDLEQGLKDYSGCCMIWGRSNDQPNWRSVTLGELFLDNSVGEERELFVYSVDNNPDGASAATHALHIGDVETYTEAADLWYATLAAAEVLGGGKVGLCVRA